YSPQRGYTAALGHMLNYWHYRRTDNTLEQVYLHGMTNAADPVKELAALSWSWIGSRLRGCRWTGWSGTTISFFTTRPRRLTLCLAKAAGLLH
ncbi:MAG: hypothetical protein ACYS32_16340, partial [Planctomycetota bacterium]